MKAAGKRKVWLGEGLGPYSHGSKRQELRGGQGPGCGACAWLAGWSWTTTYLQTLKEANLCRKWFRLRSSILDGTNASELHVYRNTSQSFAILFGKLRHRAKRRTPDLQRFEGERFLYSPRGWKKRGPLLQRQRVLWPQVEPVHSRIPKSLGFLLFSI